MATEQILTEAVATGDASSIVASLLTQDDASAQKFLTQLRQGRGSVQVTRNSLSGILELSSDERTDVQVLPPDQTSLEFELMVRHPIAYPALTSLDLYHDAITLPRQSGLDTSNVDGTSQDTPLCDPRLSRVHFADWTSVAVSGYEAAMAFSNFLEVDYALLSLFDADLFLTDLVQGEGEFCSALLVNALLGWAMLGISNNDTRRTAIAYEAYETAMQQVKRGDSPETLPTLAAIELLSLVAMFMGHGERSTMLLRQSLRVGQNMGLLAEHGTEADSVALQHTTEDEQKAKATSAWGLFSFATLHSLHCQNNELGHLSKPRFRIPEFEASASWLSSAAVAQHVNKLWEIVHVICRHYYKEGGMASEEVPVAFVAATATAIAVVA